MNGTYWKAYRDEFLDDDQVILHRWRGQLLISALRTGDRSRCFAAMIETNCISASNRLYWGKTCKISRVNVKCELPLLGKTSYS